MKELLPPRAVQLEAGLFGGIHIFADDLELGVADDPGNVPSPKNGGIFGLRLALSVLPWISFEGEIGLIPSQDNITGQNYRLYLLSYKGHALVHLLHGRLRPFVLAGVGAMQVVSTVDDPQYREIAKDTDFEFHGGVGVKYALTNELDARFDARVVFLPNTKHNSDSADWELLGGLTYRFGGHSPQAPTPRPRLRHWSAMPIVTTFPTTSTSAPTSPKIATDSRIRRLPGSRQRRRRHPRRAGQVPRQGRDQERHR
jgi:hypothetical protein